MMLYRQFATQEEIDKEYDVEKSVPDFQRYADFNINESKRARGELECLLDMRFGPTVEETLDIFPAQDPDAPILVFVHGEYWRSNSSKEFSWVARGPVALGGHSSLMSFRCCRSCEGLAAALAQPDRGTGISSFDGRATIKWSSNTSQPTATEVRADCRAPALGSF
jgi:hypothetical protein